MRACAPALALALGVALAACLDPLEPDVGPPLRESCIDEDSDPGTDVSFSEDLVPVLTSDEVGCVNCHSPTGDTPLGFEVSGLDLSSYTTLRAGGVISGSDIIVPGQPCESVALQKVSPGPPFGARMPLNGPPFLTEAQIQAFHDWIAEGARDN